MLPVSEQIRVGAAMVYVVSVLANSQLHQDVYRATDLIVKAAAGRRGGGFDGATLWLVNNRSISGPSPG